jgi:hypothetical protein
MLSFLMKKRIYIILFSGFIALLFLIPTVSAAYGSTIADAKTASAAVFSKYGWQQPGPPPPVVLPPANSQQNNQSFHGVSNSENKAILVGHNEGNTGNQGLNHGFAQDNAIDSGNQINGQRKPIGYQQNNQLIAGDGGGSNSGNSATNIGFNQGNSGNQGINLGNNQDNAANTGNQVNNQANVIGTQVNEQGSTVNNDGNVIHHQINYINLLPHLGVYVRLKPRLELALSVNR